MFELEKIQLKLGYKFNKSKLLLTAFTHKSYRGELSKENNERLEFLGDSVLGVITADYFYHNLAHLPEGVMTKKRAACVCEKSLHDFAKEINLGAAGHRLALLGCEFQKLFAIRFVNSVKFLETLVAGNNEQVVLVSQ